MGYVDDEEDGVAGLEGVVVLLHHAAVELGVGLVDSGCVDEDDLGGGMAGLSWALLFQGDLEDSVNAGAGGLGFVGDDGELLTEESVQEGRLARVGAADDGDEAGAEGHSFYYALARRLSV